MSIYVIGSFSSFTYVLSLLLTRSLQYFIPSSPLFYHRSRVHVPTGTCLRDW